MKLRNRKSYLTSLPEGEAPKNMKASITQLVYFTVILLAVIYLAFIFAQKYLYFDETGVVEAEKTIISSSRGGRIASLDIKQGQSLKGNDLIATLDATRHDCRVDEAGRADRLRYETDLNISKRIGLDAQLRQTRMSLNGHELRRALELDRGLLRNTTRLKDKKNMIMDNIGNVSREISLQKQRLRAMLSREKNTRLPDGCYKELITSPFKAVVTSVQKKAKEFARRGEAIVTLMKYDAPIRIEVYLDSDVLKFLAKGDRLALEFPDGTRSEGKIKTIYSSAYAVPERQWDNYKPVAPQIRVHLQPVRKQDRELWLAYDRMEVRVRGRK